MIEKIKMWRKELERQEAGLGTKAVFDSMLSFMGEQQREIERLREKRVDSFAWDDAVIFLKEGDEVPIIEQQDAADKARFDSHQERLEQKYFMHLVILVDDPEDASTLNRYLALRENAYFKAQAFSSRTQMVGLHHKGRRPTHIIDAIKDRSHPKFEEWYNSEVKRNVVKAEMIPDARR